jgi:Cation/multidrug efflux pump
LAIGLVVDDAIVVVEAVEHHIEHGLSPKEASLKAMEEVSAPVIGIAVILSAVFIPTAFVPGITGRLYQQFAVTIAVSVIFLGFQRSNAEPGAFGAASSAQKGISWPAGKILCLVQQGVHFGNESLRNLVPLLHSQAVLCGDPPSGFYGTGGIHGQ